MYPDYHNPDVLNRVLFNKVARVFFFNREGPTQSSIAKHFFGMWVLINSGCLLITINLTLGYIPGFVSGIIRL